MVAAKIDTKLSQYTMTEGKVAVKYHDGFIH